MKTAEQTVQMPKVQNRKDGPDFLDQFLSQLGCDDKLDSPEEIVDFLRQYHGCVGSPFILFDVIRAIMTANDECRQLDAEREFKWLLTYIPRIKLR
jgi:hypothetical protein